MNTIALSCAALISLSPVLGTSLELQTNEQTTIQMWEDVPYIMQPGSIILYDENCKPTILKGGCLDVPYIEEIKGASIEDFIADIPENATEQEKAQIEWENEVIRQALEGQDLTHPNYPKIEIVPGMKVVYNEITGDIDNIYYVDKYCPEGYSIHGEQAHIQNE